MSNTPKTASERQFQEDFTRRLERYRWTAPDALNGNKRKVTVETLIGNWRRELNRMNADQLEGVPLTDAEFQQVMARVNAISDSYEAAKLLAMENSTGKIDGIYRDAQKGVSKKQVTLTIFRKAEVGGGESTYQIAREVSTENGNRFDIVLLINGLPLINIELKRADVSLDEAFMQFKRYYQDGEYIHNFMAFSQMMVMTSPIETRYFATPRSVSRFNPSFVFHWADKANRPVNKWETVVDNFLKVPMAHQMVGDYLVLYEADNPEERCHMLMRPYQVYALQAVELAAFGRDEHTDGIPHGGYVWHTTGSGKTITSFKTALFLSTRAGFDKIIFMVDRRELDKNTSEKFQQYAAYEPVTVDSTAHTFQLEKSLTAKGIVVTTTFKMNELVKRLRENGSAKFQEKKFVFIIDEAHRTTMGQMMGTIKDHFRRNSLFFGFTGTPLFDENHVRGSINEKSEAIRTTEALFGPLLHAYTIDQAIADRNVLGFHVQYINTGEFKSYEDLRERLVEYWLEEGDNTATQDELEERAASMEDAEVEAEAEKNGLLVYQDETHIPVVVKRILDGWEAQSQARTFNAILTVAYKSRVLAYYEEFKKQLAGQENPIHVAMTVSFGSPNAPDQLPREFVEGMFKDYAGFTGVEFVAGDQKRGEDAYYADLTRRGQQGGSGRNKRNIDLIIVADQMLTGWDDKYLNVLYNDRMLELQGLIQAYSRTNRVLGSNKEFGTIINFLRPRQTEEAVKQALKLYGSGGETTLAIVDTYAAAVLKFRHLVEKMRGQLLDPTEWQLLEHDEEAKKAFIKAFRQAAKQLARLEQYYEYAWQDEPFGIDYDTWLRYVGAYKNLTSRDEEPPDVVIQPLPGRVKVVGGTKVDAAYIIELVGERSKVVDGVRVIDEESFRIILEQIQEFSDMGQKKAADVLGAFLQDLQTGKVPAGENADAAFADWKAAQYEKELSDFSAEWGLKANVLDSAVKAYDGSTPETVPLLDEIKASLDYEQAGVKHGSSRRKHWYALGERLPVWVRETRESYLT